MSKLIFSLIALAILAPIANASHSEPLKIRGQIIQGRFYLLNPSKHRLPPGEWYVVVRRPGEREALSQSTIERRNSSFNFTLPPGRYVVGAWYSVYYSQTTSTRLCGKKSIIIRAHKKAFVRITCKVAD